MFEGLSALILLTTLSLHQTAEAPQQIPLIVAHLGDNIYLTCPVSGEESWLFNWYKLNFGYMVQTLAKGGFKDMKLQGQFDNPRFTIMKAGNLYTLTIRNITKEDEATYFCQAGEPHIMTFINGTNLVVKDHKNQQKHIYVKQSPETASVQPGNSATLQCSLLFKHKETLVQCPGEHSVHWFRAGSGRSHPGIIYTQSSRRDEQEEKSCVYSLSKTIHNSSDAGTYYCAVVTCGEILFGEGTKVEMTLHQTAEAPQQIPLIVANLGDNIYLTCPGSGKEAWLFNWYKLNFGYMVQTIAKGGSKDMKLQGQFDNARFTIMKAGDLYTLTIRNITKDDEATYFCQAGEPYILTFTNGTILAVKDHKNQQKHIYVKQIPETASVQPGNSTTLQCSLLFKHKETLVQCPGEHSVHWFRAGSGRSHPGILYTQSSRRDEQEDKSCVYSLSKTIHNSSDAGTYYCAVVTCGEILFGEGTKVEMRQEQLPLVIAVGTLMLCCVIVIVALILIEKACSCTLQRMVTQQQ